MWVGLRSPKRIQSIDHAAMVRLVVQSVPLYINDDILTYPNRLLTEEGSYRARCNEFRMMGVDQHDLYSQDASPQTEISSPPNGPLHWES